MLCEMLKKESYVSTIFLEMQNYQTSGRLDLNLLININNSKSVLGLSSETSYNVKISFYKRQSTAGAKIPSIKTRIFHLYNTIKLRTEVTELIKNSIKRAFTQLFTVEMDLKNGF